MPFPAIYRARATRIDGLRVTAFVPQVFGESSIIVDTFLGGPPTEPGLGWVMFQGGNPEFPVWAGNLASGAGGGGGGGEDEVFIGPDMPSGTYELWVDSDEHPPEPTVVSISYIHVQPTPASVWNITHNMGFNPNVTVVDSGGSVAEGDIAYPSLNTVRLTFSGAFSGTAYLS